MVYAANKWSTIELMLSDTLVWTINLISSRVFEFFFSRVGTFLFSFIYWTELAGAEFYSYALGYFMCPMAHGPLSLLFSFRKRTECNVLHTNHRDHNYEIFNAICLSLSLSLDLK